MGDEVTVTERPEGAQVRIELSRDLRLFDITMIGIGAMIGAGIFVLTGSAARVAGPAAILAFAINGLVTLLTAFTYAELGSSYPEAGGGYLWAKEGLPPPAGFLSGWMSWIAHIIACSLYAAAFGSFVYFTLGFYGVSEFLLPAEVGLAGLSFNPLQKIIAVAIVLFFVLVNYVGVQTTGKTESLVTVGKILVLGVFIVFGTNAMIQDPTVPERFLKEFIPEETGAGGILLAMGLTFIAFEGYEIIAQSGEEVKNPKKNIPKAIFLSIFVVVVVYILTFIVAIGVVEVTPECEKAHVCLGSGEPELAMIEAAIDLLGPWGLALMVSGGLLAAVSALNATIYSSSRVSFAMGRDGSLPKLLGGVHPKRKTPGNAVVVSGVIIATFAVILPIEQIAASADVMFLLLFTMANLSLLTLRKKRPDLDRGFWVPLFPFIPILGIAANLFLAISLWNFPAEDGQLGAGQVAWYVAILWLSLGLAYHFFKGGREEIEKAPPIRREILEVIASPLRRAEKVGHRVLVPLRDPGNLRMVELATELAKEREAELIIVHVIEVPLTLPPKSIRFGYVDERIKALQAAQELARERGVEVSVVVKIAHRVYETILDTAEEEGADLLVLGWRGERPARGGRILGSNIDFLVQRAKCDIVVFKAIGMKERLERITLLAGHAWHVAHAARVAALLSRQHGAQVTVLSVIPHKSVEEATIADAHRLMKVLEELGVQHEHKIVYSGSIVDAVVKEAAKCDLLVMGASPTWVLRKYAFGPLEDRIAKKVTCPVLMLRKAAERPKPEGTGA
jgi:amino acid transporter/nucleotide-binding universal stress UspA family protein